MSTDCMFAEVFTFQNNQGATRARPWRSRYFLTIWICFISWILRRISLPALKTKMKYREANLHKALKRFDQGVLMVQFF